MTKRVGILLCFLAAVSMTMVAQDEPVLTSANLPKYPPVACQARVQGVVTLTFTLVAHASEPTNIEVVSGHPLLNGAALENVKTWRFDNPYAVERRYETTFKYRLLDRKPAGGTKKLTVSLESFHNVEIVTDANEPPVNY
jgi:TonB family protein